MSDTPYRSASWGKEFVAIEEALVAAAIAAAKPPPNWFADGARGQDKTAHEAPTPPAASGSAMSIPPPSDRSARPPFHTIYMDLAWALSKRSTCRRLAVGCVIASVDHRKVLSVGYNGNATGLPNDCDSDTPGSCGDIHAESNAIINCDAPRATEKIVYVTHLPCVMCAKMLVNLGGVKLVLSTPRTTAFGTVSRCSRLAGSRASSTRGRKGIRFLRG